MQEGPVFLCASPDADYVVDGAILLMRSEGGMK
jgi:hypothetical protein